MASPIFRKKIIIPVLVVVVLGLIIAGNLFGNQSEGKKVKLGDVSCRSLETWVRAPGRIQPVVSVDMSSNVTGRVVELNIEEGDRVHKGQLLLALDETRYRSAVAQYEAMVRAAESQLVLAEARLDLANQVLARRQSLSDGGLLSSEELESALVDVRINIATVNAQGAEIARLEAAVEENRRDLEETHFLAPMDGVVTALNLEVGENVMIGTMNNAGTVILTISDLTQMEVEARVNESDVILLSPGNSVKIDVDAMPDTTLTGAVTTVGESGSRLSRDEGAEFEIHIKISDPPRWLRPGMSADVEIQVAAADSVITVPIQALVARDEVTVQKWEDRRERREAGDLAGETDDSEDESDESDSEDIIEDRKGTTLITGIFVVDETRACFKRVELGVRGETFIQVVSGLTAEDEIIKGPYKVLRRLNDHDKVTSEKNNNN
jgi:HlyD family secretion protein